MPRAPLRWRHRKGELVLDRTRIMAVLNVTPDSFSDGGLYVDPEVAIRQGLEMVEAGADLIDVGGESTRPGADPVSAEEEWRRVGRVIEGLARKVDVPVSVDTYRAEVAAKAIHVGASIVNDVTGLRDIRMIKAIVRGGAGAVLMHMLGEPKTMQTSPRYDDVVKEVCTFLEARAKTAISEGVPAEAIAVDPGIGFGKTLEHNLELIRHLDEVASLGYPVVIGVSRKSFLGKLGAGASGGRLIGSIAAATAAVAHGAHIVRAHDVAETVRAMRVADALLRSP